MHTGNNTTDMKSRHYYVSKCAFPLLLPPCWPSGKGVFFESSRPGLNSHLCHGSFSGMSHTSDFKTGISVATMPHTRHFRASTGTGWPCVSILNLGENEIV